MKAARPQPVLLEEFAVMKRPLASLPRGSQVIVLRQTDRFVDPLFEVEYRGRREFLYLSDFELLGARWPRAAH